MIAVDCLIQSYSVSLSVGDTVDFQRECFSRCYEVKRRNVDRLGKWKCRNHRSGGKLGLLQRSVESTGEGKRVERALQADCCTMEMRLENWKWRSGRIVTITYLVHLSV